MAPTGLSVCPRRAAAALESSPVSHVLTAAFHVQVTQVSVKPVLTHESFYTYNEFVKNIIAVGSYHLEENTLRILFGE